MRITLPLALDRLPGVVTPFDPRLALTQAGWQSTVWGMRVVVPRGGTLHDLAVVVGPISAGNLRLGIYDTGDASAGNRTLKYDSGTVAAGSINTAQVLGDPALAVTAGQQLDFAVQASASTVNLFSLGTSSNGFQLPTNYLPVPGGASPKLAWTYSQAFGAFPATLAEASCVVTPYTPLIMARVS